MPHENHHRRHKREAKAEPLTTIVSVVYVTASKTFSGSVAGYSTLGGEDASAAASNSVTEYWVSATLDNQVISWLTTDTLSPANAVATVSPEASTTTEKSSATQTAAASSAMTSSALMVDTSSVVTNPSTTLATSQTSVLVAPSTLHTSTSASKTVASPTSSSTASADAAVAAGSSSGLSSGGVAGIIVAVLLVVGSLAGVWFCLRRKSKKMADPQEHEGEKGAYAQNDMHSARNDMQSARSSLAAPKLQPLRPVTEFDPNFGGGAETYAMGTTSLWEKVGSERSETNRENPFGTHAAASSNEQDESNPFGNHAATAGGATVGGAAGALPRRSLADVPKPLALTKSVNTSDSSELSPGSMTSMSSSGGAFALSSPGGNPLPVHRVVFQFDPTMTDEISLKLGSVVRLINAYDDGWCLVIRMDGSEQGVCPRTCLSGRPIKPKPRPHNQQQGRPMTPTQGSPLSPTQGRAMTQGLPVIARKPPAPLQASGQVDNAPSLMRPIAPGQARPMTPGSGGHPPPSFQIPAPMTPASGPSASQAPASTGASKALPMSPSTNKANNGSDIRSLSSSGSENQGVAQNGTGSDQGSSSSGGESPSPPAVPAKNPAPSQIPLPSTPVRKPVPGQAM